MLPTRIDIQRTWTNRDEARSSLLSDEITLEELSEAPLYILLGEPGAGKTDTVKTYTDSHAAIYARIAHVDTAGTLNTYVRRAFEEQRELFLDGYDERQQFFRNTFVTDALDSARRINQIPRIRIVSRDAYISDQFVESLKALNSIGAKDDQQSTFPILKINSLTEEQVNYWLKVRLDNKKELFINEVNRLHLQDFLHRPIDLEMLIKAYSSNSELGDSATSAWLNAIKAELDEHNQERKEALYSTRNERLWLAQILAACELICSGRRVIIPSVTDAPPNDSDITPDSLSDELSSFKETPNTKSLRYAFEEATRSRLFQQTKDGITFDSQAKAQFLLASYLSTVPFKQLKTLITTSNASPRVPPQLLSVATEIAKQMADLFTWLCEVHPEALLHYIIPEYTKEQRVRLVASLFNNSDILHWRLQKSSLKYLHHPGIADQLLPYVTPSADVNHQLLAIAILRQGNTPLLTRELGKLLTSHLVKKQVRDEAALALANMGDEGRPFLKGYVESLYDSSDEAEDTLFAAAMISTWPHQFSPETTFSFLREPRSPSGIYYAFLTYMEDSAASRLDASHIVPGLSWLAARGPSRQEPDRYYKHVEWRIVHDAWLRIEEPEVLASLGKYAHSRIINYKNTAVSCWHTRGLLGKRPTLSLSTDDYDSNTHARWCLFRHWLDEHQDSQHIWSACNAFIRPGDLEELLAEAGGRPEITRTELVSWIKRELLRLYTSEGDLPLRCYEGRISSLGMNLEELLEQFKVEVSKPKQEEATPKTQLLQENSDNLQALLDSAELDSFPLILQLLFADSQGHFHPNALLPPDPSRWNALDTSVRKQVLLHAKNFLSSESFTHPSWERGYIVLLTLWLLATFDTAGLSDCPNILITHAATVFYWGGSFADELALVKRSYKCLNVEQLFKVVSLDIRCQLSGADRTFDAHQYKDFWQPALGPVMIAEAERTSGIYRVALLDVLAANDATELRPALTDWLEAGVGESLVSTVDIVLRWRIRSHFGMVSELALRNVSVMDAVVSYILEDDLHFDREDRAHFGSPILLRAFEKVLPVCNPAEDVKKSWGAITERTRRQWLRDSLAGEIARRDDEIGQRFVARFATLDRMLWLRDVADDARLKRIEESWQAPLLTEVVRMRSGPSGLYLRDEIDLQSAVLLALEELRPEFETLDILWRDRKTSSPADETAITALLTWLLKLSLHGFVINAEPKLKNGFTDIQIEAVVRDAESDTRVLKCVVEAKKCVHKDLKSAVDKQLYRKYLEDSPSTAGIYLVFWLCKEDECTCRCGGKVETLPILESQAEQHGGLVKIASLSLK